MRIAIVGYGKMGHMIKNAAESKKHEIVATIDTFAEDASVKVSSDDTASIVRAVKSSKADGIIEFSHPSAVMNNIRALLPLGLPMIVGTTGWTDKENEVNKLAASCGGVIMHSSNFSIGVTMFYRIVEEAVKILQPYSEYDCAVWEMHHNQKVDSPSGTALEIASRILKNNSQKTEIVTNAFHNRPEKNQLHVSSTRCGSVPGTHKVFFDSSADTIELTHTARNREGFASGAVLSLERLSELILSGKLRRGHLYGMEDLF